MNPLLKLLHFCCRIEVREMCGWPLNLHILIPSLFCCSLSNSVSYGHWIQHRRTFARQRQKPLCVSSNVESIQPHILILLSFASEHQVYPSVHLRPENKLSLIRQPMYACVCLCVWEHARLDVCIYIYICICVCLCVFVCLCACV